MSDFKDYAQGDLRYVYSEVAICFNDNQIKLITWDGIPMPFRDLLVAWLKEIVVNYDPCVKQWQTFILTQPYTGPVHPEEQLRAHNAMKALKSFVRHPSGGPQVIMRANAKVPDIQMFYKLVRTYKSNFRRIGRAILSLRVSDNRLITR